MHVPAEVTVELVEADVMFSATLAPNTGCRGGAQAAGGTAEAAPAAVRFSQRCA